MIKIFVITHIRVLHICIGLKKNVLGCFEDIAQSYKNPNHVKYPIKALSCQRMFFIVMKGLQLNVSVQGIWNFVSTLVHLMHVVFRIKQLGLNLAIWFVLMVYFKQCGLDL
jgi:hypothetical protein